jgi:hypothetical protein
MEWHFYGMGQFHGPFSLERMLELTSGMPQLFPLACGVSDVQLSVLEKHPKVIGLALMSPHVTVAATATLRALPRLQELILCGPAITDDFLLGLSGITTLQDLTLIHTACTKEGVSDFLGCVPECEVYRAGADSILPASLRTELQLFVSGEIIRRQARNRGHS